jgi:two-component system cell cycle response regulator DivK
LHTRSVLVVDHDVDTVEMYALGLSLAGYYPLMATDAETATRLSKTHHPSAVVTDLSLAGTGGWDLIQTLRDDPGTRQIPIIVLTGRTDSYITDRAAAAGCVAVLTKPCVPDALAKVLLRLVPSAPTLSTATTSGDGGDGLDAC